jgi:hypothetical protein
MLTRRSRIAIYGSIAMLVLVFLLPGFCTCSTCMVKGAKPESCSCTVLGVYLGRKVLMPLINNSGQSQNTDKGDCKKR